MGLLDDAIRDHLDLKRRSGANPTEVERMEQEALGPVRREPTIPSAPPNVVFDDEPDFGPTAAGEPDFDPTAVDDAHEHEATWAEPPAPLEKPKRRFSLRRHEAEPVEAHRPEATSPVVDHEEAIERFRAEKAQELPIDDPTAVPDDDPFADELDEHGLEVDHPTEAFMAPATPEPPPPPAAVTPSPPAPAEAPLEPPTPAPPSGEPVGETVEYDVERALDEDDSDILEETPEFLEDTPDHDRLWFEQKPPRDFDFDG